MQENSALPGGKLFAINEFACLQSAKLIKGYRPSAHVSHFLDHELRTKVVFKMAFISICHQINWDFLQGRLAKNLLSLPYNTIIETIGGITARTLGEWLSDCPQPERVRATERSEYLRDIGVTLARKYNGDPLLPFQLANGQLIGSTGFISQMDSFEAYCQDPIRKKTHVLCHDLVREEILRFHDEQHLKPAVDYHLIRIYLRTGRVFPLHRETFSILSESAPNPRMRLVTELRKTVSSAVELVAELSGLSVPAINYIEWQLGRNICVHTEPLCLKNSRCKNIDPDVAALFKSSCPYESFCQGFSDPDWMSLNEPAFNKSFY